MRSGIAGPIGHHPGPDHVAPNPVPARRGTPPRVLFAGVVTGLTAAALLLLVKGLFFYADNGFRDPGQGGQITCAAGADCVYQRYLQAGRGPDLLVTGVTDRLTRAVAGSCRADATR